MSLWFSDKLKVFPPLIIHYKVSDVKIIQTANCLGETHPVCRKNHYLLVTVAIKAFTVMILERFEINVFYADMLLLLADTSLRALQSGIMLTERLNREESHQHLAMWQCFFPDMLLHKWSVFNLHTVTIVITLCLFTLHLAFFAIHKNETLVYI